ARLRIEYGVMENGWVSGREIDVFGTKDNGDPFVLNRSGTFQNTDYAVSSTDLLHGLTPTLVGTLGDPVTNLNNGVFNEVTFNNDETLTYALDLVTSPYGYNLTEIRTYGRHADDGRDGQNYRIEVSFVGTPDTFALLADVFYNPNTGLNPSNTETSIQPGAGYLAERVAKIRFNFTVGQENGWVKYCELDVQGVPVPPPSGAVVMFR
ncbi:hypothetical protein ACFLQU_04615, partial [Verrucomicrobiota bacterium]